MKKIRSAIIGSLLFIISGGMVYAQSAAELQIELNALLQQLGALQGQLQTTTGSPNSIPQITGVYGSCPSLSRTLRKGLSGSDVTGLQAFLAADATIYPEGTISGYFGALTEAAVRNFQSRHGIVNSGTPDTTGWGVVGPATRAAIASICASKGMSPTIPTPSVPTAAGLACVIGNVAIGPNQTGTFYSVSTAPSGATCAAFASTRQCVNGRLSGNAAYQFTSCAETQESSYCSVDGTLIAPNRPMTFYSRTTVNFGESCSSYAQTRTCANGIMSGSSQYNFTSCRIKSARSCDVGDTNFDHGISKTFYKKSLVPYGESCTTSANALSRLCSNGSVSGDSTFNKPSCTSATSSSCVLDGFTIANGSTKDFYSTRTAPYTTGTACPAQYKLTRKCVNGVFDGDENFKYATCVIGAGSSCKTEDGYDVAHGAVRSLYKSPTVAYNGNCEAAANKMNRTCTNGVFSGTGSTADFKYYSCTAATAFSCTTTDNVSVSSGTTVNLYDRSSVPFSSGSCPATRSRTCTNGVWSATYPTYTYKNCSVGAAPAPTCTLQTDKSAYLPGQYATFNWTTQNATAGSLLNIAIPTASLASGSRTNAIKYDTTGDRTITLSLEGNGKTGQCSATMRVQDVLLPDCTLQVKKNGSNAVAGNSVTVNPDDDLLLTWTSSRATEYATSSSLNGLSVPITTNVNSGSEVVLDSRATSYTYAFTNSAGTTQCSVKVAYNPPTCSTVTSDKSAYIYGDDVRLSWTSTNADYATATSSSRVPLNGTNVLFKNIKQTTTYNITFTGLGGTKVCSKQITIATPLIVTSPITGVFQKTNSVLVSWQYTAPPANTKVRLDLTDPDGNVIGTIDSNLNPTGSIGWTVPEQLNGVTLNGQYRIRAVGAVNLVDKARYDSGVFTINPVTGYLSSSQLASALAALEALLKEALVKLGL